MGIDLVIGLALGAIVLLVVLANRHGQWDDKFDKDREKRYRRKARAEAAQAPPPAAIAFACPNCARRYQGSASLRGTSFVCRQCGKTFVV